MAIDGGGVLQTAVDLNSKALTNGGDISAANANGYKLVNAAATTTVPTFLPNRADADSGSGGGAATQSLTANGTEVARARINGGSVAELDIPDGGSVSALGLAFINDTDTGVWRSGTNQWILVAGGANKVVLDTTDHFWYGAWAQVTAGTMTYTSAATPRTVWNKFTWTNAMVVALGATTTGNISVCTLPAKTLVKRVIVVITGAAAGPAAVTISVGRTAASYIDYLVASDAKAAANTIYGDLQADIGADLTGTAGVGLFDSLPSYTGTTVVNAQFISTGANLNTVTGSTGLVMIQTELLP